MADGVEFKLVGVEQLIATLNDVTYETKRKGGRAALRKAAMVVRNAAAANAAHLDDPATAENISKNIAVRWNGRQFRRTGDPQFRVGVLGGARAPAEAVGELRAKGKGNPGGDTFYWRFLEFGTERQRAQPFMRPALESNINLATNTFVTEYQKALDRAIKRAQSRGAKA